MKTRSFCAALLLAPALLSAQMTLIETGGTFRTDATNLALSATPKSDGDYGGGHFAININDGNYGNASSWLGSAGNFYSSIALGFSTPVTLGSVAFGRDNTGVYADRATGSYEIYYSTNYVSGASVYGSSTIWHLLQILDYASSPPESPALRHLYNFDTPLTNVTGFMISVPSFLNPDGYAAMAIDEIELYSSPATAGSAVPEPSTYAALFGAAALGLVAYRRRRTTVASRAA